MSYNYRERALKIAESQIGVKEVGNNWGPKVKQYLASADISFPAAWCMAFVHWCYERAGLELRHINPASVGFFAAWGTRMGYQVYKPQRGDVVCFNFDSNLWPDHVGLVRQAAFGMVRTVEGNTQSGTRGDQAEGGGVYPRIRRTSRCVFIRVPGEAVYQYADKREERKIYLRSWILRQRRIKSLSWKQIKNHPYGKEYYEVLGGK